MMKAEIAIAKPNEHSNQQHLTFMLADEEYGIDILRVQEIKGWDSVTDIPNTPGYIKGVINLRGLIVPIIDLRMLFQLPEQTYSKMTVVIIVKIVNSVDAKDRIIGMVVDAVSDVYQVPTEDLRPAPTLGGHVDMEFVRGIANLNDKSVIILHIDKLFNADHLSEIDEINV